jgi:hypothetical protein
MPNKKLRDQISAHLALPPEALNRLALLGLNWVLDKGQWIDAVSGGYRKMDSFNTAENMEDAYNLSYQACTRVDQEDIDEMLEKVCSDGRSIYWATAKERTAAIAIALQSPKRNWDDTIYGQREFTNMFTVVDHQCEDGNWRCICRLDGADYAVVILPVRTSEDWHAALEVAQGIFKCWRAQG